MTGEPPSEEALAPTPPLSRRGRTFRIFETPRVGTYFLGLLGSMSGFWIRLAAMGWLVYEVTGQKDKLGEIAAASLLPWVVIAPWAGVLADRVNPRRVMLAIYLLVIASNLGLAVVLLQGPVSYETLLIFAVAVGILRGIENPARAAFVRYLVGRELLAEAIGLSAAGMHVCNAVGFGLAGVIYAAGGPAACFFAVAGCTVVMVVQMIRLRDVDCPPQPISGLKPLAQLREGFAYVLGHRQVRTLITSAGLTVVLLLSYRTLMPAVAKDALGYDAAAYGLLMSVSGVGSLIAAVWIAGSVGDPLSRSRRMVGLTWVTCLSLGVVAVSRVGWLTAVAIGVAGFCQVGFMATANTTVQQLIPDALRGRVMGIWVLMFGASFPLGSYLMGWIAERWGAGEAILVGVGAATVMAAIYTLRLRSLWRDPVRAAQLERSTT